MEFEKVAEIVKGMPFISDTGARIIYDLILHEKLTRILELGIAHGAATCYMAAALEELGGGNITSVDLIEAQEEFKPSPEYQLAKAGLSNFVNIVRMQTGYTWFLHNEIQRLTRDNICAQEYDLCIIDGPKNWTIDGCAFFLVDKILKENGWLIFDDLNWTYAGADERRDSTDGITHRKLSEEERITPQVREIFELLVKQHQNYSHFQIVPEIGWAIARKTASSRKDYTILYTETYRDVLAGTLNGIKQRVKKLFRA
jgi:predicted O-methyltransferase YrrM